MFWKSWKRGVGPQEPTGRKAEKLPGPKDIPEVVGRHLVVRLNKNPDWVWNLRAVVRPREDSKSAFDVRVFEASEVAARKVHVKDFTSFDEHPELILFEGRFDKKSMEVHVEEKERPQPTTKAA